MPRTNKQIDIAFDLVNSTNTNIFLSGKAGTGKSTFIKKLQETVRKRIVLVAPSGVASVNVGGVTINSFFQLPFSPYIPGSTNLKNYKIKESKRDVMRSMELLIIDEISMVRADMLDAIDDVLRRERGSNLPFGGVQLLMVGDLFQLSPITPKDVRELFDGVYDTDYFFGSHALRRSGFVTIELNHIYRQEDQQFKELLNKVRVGNNDWTVMRKLNERYRENFNPDDSEGYIRVMTHATEQADVYNAQRLTTLEGEERTYVAKIEGDFHKSNYPTAVELQLKVGARVMFIKNNSQKGIYNGMLGTVMSIKDDSVEIKPDTKDSTISVGHEVWSNTEYVRNSSTGEIEEKVIGSFSQIPVRLAWAITVHKSQGLTFDKVILDLHRCFTHGQAYVALSRCRTLGGIVLSSYVGKRAILCDGNVKTFMSTPEHAMPTEDKIVEMKKDFFMVYVRKLYEMQQICTSLEGLVSDANMRYLSSTRRPAIREVIEEFNNYTALNIENFLLPVKNMVMVSSDYQTNEQVLSMIKHNSIFLLNALDKVKQSLDTLHVDESASAVMEAWNKTKEMVDKKMSLLKLVIENGFVLSDVQDVLNGKQLKSSDTEGAISDDTDSVPVPEPKVPSHHKTLQLFNVGKTIDQIAQERSLAESTVQSHLFKCVEEGMLEVTELWQEEIPEELTEYLKGHLDTPLKETYEHFDGKYPYLELRVAKHLILND